ncbi:MAG: restriction endonuclease subunit S [Caldisericales bacterium]|nr:restriction endonuclease subunit S [Caldisericales bacterium]
MGSNVWEKQKIGEIALINMGQSPESKYYNNERIGLPFLQGNRTFGFKYPTYDTFCSSGNKFADPNDILISVRAPVGDLNIAKERICIGRGLSSLKMKNGNYEYLFYLLKANIQELINRESGTVFGSINKDDIYNLEVIIAQSDDDQRRIADILSALDDKIELNRQTNATLEAIAQAIFKEWFVDFNFPGATGEMIDSDLGLIPEGWRVGKLEEIITNFDRKRVPLSSRERENRKGAFPYYGAASILDYVDDYIFDGVYLLMGEDGTVITEDGKPVLQYVSGKFWVNNHTHVLQGKKPFSTEYVLLQLKNTNVKHIVTGAVQPKINQGNMNELPVVIPDEFTLLSFQDAITPIFSNILDTEQETSILTGIRDNLLPKLMNGEIEV